MRIHCKPIILTARATLNFASFAQAAALVAILCSSAANCHAQIPAARMSAVYPAGIQAGGTIEMQVAGTGLLDEIDTLQFSHPGIKAELVQGQPAPFSEQTLPQYGKFQVTAAPDVAPGIYEVNAKGRNGFTNSRLVWVSKQPQITAPAQAAPTAPAPAITLGTIVHDRYRDQQRNAYTLTLAAGQVVRVAVMDQRLDSRALTVLKVISPAGKAIAQARSLGGFGAQAIVKADAAGDYRIELSDAIYRGGEPYHYALLCEDAALTNEQLSAGSDLLQLIQAYRPQPHQVPLGETLEAYSLPAFWNGAPQPILVSPNTEGARLAPPTLIAAEFQSGQQSLTWDFESEAGKDWWIEIAAQQIGSLCDPRVEVARVTEVEIPASPATGGVATKQNKLEKVKELDDAGAIGSAPTRVNRVDPILSFNAGAAGRYRITVTDQLTGKRPEHSRAFLLSLSPVRPALAGLAMWVTPTNNAAQFAPVGNRLLRGGRAAMRVLIDRRQGFSGDVHVTAEGLPTGVTCPKLILSANQIEGHLVFAAADDAPSFAGPIQIMARSAADPNVAVSLQPASVSWETQPTWNSITTRLGAQFVLSVTEQDTAPITFNIGDGNALEMARGGKLPITAVAVRRAGGADKAVLRAQNLPPNVTIAEFAIEPNTTEGKGELVVAANAVPGEYSMWFQVETKVKIRNNPQAFDRATQEVERLDKLLADPARAAEKPTIEAAKKAATDKLNALKDPTGEKESQNFIPSNAVALRVVDSPFQFTSPTVLEIKRGEQKEFAVQIGRKFGFEGAVDLKLATEPKPAWLEITPSPVPEKMDMGKLVIKISPDAPVGDQSIAIKSSYKFNNQDLNISSSLTIRIAE